jgi:hypothetical protein
MFIAIHGPADEESTAGVFCMLDIPGVTSGTFYEGQSPGTCGTIELSVADVANFEGGRMYVSIRTEDWANGELRGQLK